MSPPCLDGFSKVPLFTESDACVSQAALYIPYVVYAIAFAGIAVTANDAPIVVVAVVGLAYSITVCFLNTFSWASLALFAVWSGLFLATFSMKADRLAFRPNGVITVQLGVYCVFLAALFMPVAFYNPTPDVSTTQVTAWLWSGVICTTFVFEALIARKLGPVVLAVLAAGAIGVSFANPPWAVLPYVGAAMVLMTSSLLVVSAPEGYGPVPEILPDK